jgi:hypothetical protein
LGGGNIYFDRASCNCTCLNYEIKENQNFINYKFNNYLYDKRIDMMRECGFNIFISKSSFVFLTELKDTLEKYNLPSYFKYIYSDKYTNNEIKFRNNSYNYEYAEYDVCIGEIVMLLSLEKILYYHKDNNDNMYKIKIIFDKNNDKKLGDVIRDENLKIIKKVCIENLLKKDGRKIFKKFFGS